MPNKDTNKKTIWQHISSTNGKIAVVIAFFVGYQELMPIVKDVLGFTADNNAIISECKIYTDIRIEEEHAEYKDYIDLLLHSVDHINDRYVRDSIIYANKYNKFAVGFRSDLNGIMSYRDRFGKDCSVRISQDTTVSFEFYNQRKQKWDRCFFEDK